MSIVAHGPPMKYFSYFFSQEIGFDISCKLSPKAILCMKRQSLFWWGKKKNINLLSVESAQTVVKVKETSK